MPKRLADYIKRYRKTIGYHRAEMTYIKHCNIAILCGVNIWVVNTRLTFFGICVPI